MKPAPFAYHAPESVTDAATLLHEFGDDAKVLAGGQSLVPMLALRLTQFAQLIDLNRVETLRGTARSNGTLTIGAMTRQRALERDPLVATTVPLLARAAPLIGHFQIRNRGTVGGSLAHADPASELPAVAVALDATFVATDHHGSTRIIAAADFFESTWTTALAGDEILTEVRFPVTEQRHHGCAIREIARRHGDFAMAGALADIDLDGDGRLARAGIALFGVAPTPWRASQAEAALLGSTPDTIDAAAIAALAVADVEPADDIHATAAQRRHMARHLVATVVGEAIEEARNSA